MKKADFMAFVGKNVEITLFDGDVLKGQLSYCDEFSQRHGWRQPGYFYIAGFNVIFKFSHVAKVKEIKS